MTTPTPATTPLEARAARLLPQLLQLIQRIEAVRPAIFRDAFTYLKHQGAHDFEPSRESAAGMRRLLGKYHLTHRARFPLDYDASEATALFCLTCPLLDEYEYLDRTAKRAAAVA